MKKVLLLVMALGLLGMASADLQDGMVAYWPFDGDYTDAAPGGHDGTPNGGIQFVTGVAGKAADFDGAGGTRVDIGTWNPTANTGQLSVSCWAKWAGTGATWQGLIGKRDAWSEGMNYWHIESTATSVYFQSYTADSISTGGFPAGTWMHVVATFDGTTGYLYIDGVLANSGTFWFADKPDSMLQIGSSEANGGNPFSGAIDDMTLWDRPLTVDEINEIYVKGNGGLAAISNEWNPTLISPADGATDVSVDGVLLEWTAPGVASPEPIIRYDVYLDTDKGEVIDPNLDDALIGSVNPGETLAFDSGSLANDSTYYWKVVAFVNDANTAPSLIASFDTQLLNPIITTDPVGATVGPDCIAAFSVAAISGPADDGGELSYQWKDANGANVPGGDTDTIIADVAGSYYCVVTNDYGSANSASATLDIQEHGAGELGMHVGPEALAAGEGWSKSDGVYTIAGAGRDIWEQQDDFYYVYKELQGDADVVVRVTELVNEANHAWQKAGVMIYDDLENQASAFAFCALTSSNGMSFQRRNTANTNAGSSHDGGEAYPYWVNLVRVGDVFSAYHAPDVAGAPGAWTKQGGDETIVMADPVYIGLAVVSHVSNTISTARFDNVTLFGTSWKPINQMPDGSEWIDPNFDLVLSWESAELAPCSDDVEYDVFWGLDPAAVADINAVPNLTVTDLQAVIPASQLNYEDEMYWRVDVRTTDDSEQGDLWYFEATKLIPNIVSQPQMTAAVLGNTATFSVQTSSDTPVTYEWFMEADGADVSKGAGVTDGNINTVTLAGVTSDDDGMYYCIATNDSGPKQTDSARLEIGQLIGHWTMDAIDDGIVADSSIFGRDGSVMPAVVEDVNVPPEIVAGKIGNAVDFNPGELNGQWIDVGLTASELEIGGSHAKSVSAWVYPREMTDGAIWDLGSRSGGQNFSLRTESESRGDHGWRVQYWGGDYNFNTNEPWNLYDASESWNSERPAPVAFPSKDAWVHFVLAYGDGVTKVYANGRLIVIFDRELNTGELMTFRIGGYGANENPPSQYFNGLIDDLRLYNYALSATEAAQLYTDVEGGSACPEPPLYDFNGDCVVDMLDFAIFMEGWMECGWIPCN